MMPEKNLNDLLNGRLTSDSNLFFKKPVYSDQDLEAEIWPWNSWPPTSTPRIGAEKPAHKSIYFPHFE